ncbi:MAG: nickel pincer cofactor biosynthesis protein LarB [candidate division Zixibacteria bacterium]|nr:nickel pincer cofactor biosynthesis protein LarB [candidate division Zixibacteria bacterium]
MNPQIIKQILHDVKTGKISLDEALGKLKYLPFENLGFANIDHHRTLRTGMPEVIFAPGKTAVQIIKLVKGMKKTGIDVLITRTDLKIYKMVKDKYKSAIYNPDARIIHIPTRKKKTVSDDIILVISAGTSDIPVAEEAAITAEVMGNKVTRIFDVGVAGIHRLLAHKASLEKASVIIVVAGMEGALASVVGGLTDVPVIAVPTSIGYGASFNGISALLGMLNSCVPGVVVVNIDNGFGAACAANLIIKKKK